MNFRALIFAAILIPVSVFANEPVSISSVPFQSVDYLKGLNSRVIFDSVRLYGKNWKLAVLADKVELVLLEEENIYTTLNLVNAGEYDGSVGWLKAEKATVVVRSSSDFKLWQIFLEKIKKEQELERKKWEEPVRVLPPDK